MTTLGASETRPGPTPPAPFNAGVFAPGTLLADRYRIVSLAGRGGMGEVYRAEDLRLGQTVALKFLPASLEGDLSAHRRLLAEVRSARSVSHPNVCRVYDVGEVQHRSFLTMEYIDGEDLGSLLRRIGRLPADKALEVARQISAGLAAAHDKGVLHRDLKPANVMIDGRGQARITDFGLAVDAQSAASLADFAGTPAYMAPERFQGRPATVQSDLYSLGLILYETFTGKPALKAANVGDWQRVHTDATPISPSELVSDMPPAVERAIFRCLEKEPSRRPGSAAQVSAALPGGDPLAAAVAAGETPSPELVAASGEEGTLPRAQAWLRLAACAAGFVAVMTLGSWWSLANWITLPHPELQRERARQILRDLGYTEPPVDDQWWMVRNAEYVEHFRSAADRGLALATAVRNPAALLFCYRQSPVPLDTSDGRVSADNPAPSSAGDAYLELGTTGRLIELRVIPSRHGTPASPPAAIDWFPLLAAAGIEPGRLTPAEPAWGPIYAFDSRAAWEGVVDNERVRVEAAGMHGRATFFRLTPAWMVQPAAEGAMMNAPRAFPLFAWISSSLMFGGVAFLAVLAVRNLRAGRGDRRGAYRLSRFIILVGVFGNALARHWTIFSGAPGPMGGGTGGSSVGQQIIGTLGAPLFMGLAAWAAYLGFEPYVRRRWPQLLIASTRLLEGRWRDPLVGRSILTGTLSAIAMFAGLSCTLPILSRQGWGVIAPGSTFFRFSGFRTFAGNLAIVFVVFLVVALVYLAVLLLARLLLRNTAFAWLGLFCAFCGMYVAWGRVFLGPDPAQFVLAGVALAGTSVLVLWRSGLLALGVWLVVTVMLRDTPWTLAVTRWYGWPTWLATALIAALVFWGFRNVLGRQTAFPAE